MKSDESLRKDSTQSILPSSVAKVACLLDYDEKVVNFTVAKTHWDESKWMVAHVTYNLSHATALARTCEMWWALLSLGF